MPPADVRSPHERRLWDQAKRQAAKAGHAQDWAYVTDVYERLRTHVGGAKARDAYRQDMHRNQPGRLVLRRGVDTLQGAEDNPQVADPADNSRITEQGVTDPKTPVETPTMPGTIRVYKNGKPTKYAIHPEAEPKPMVYSKRGEDAARRITKARPTRSESALIEELAEQIHNIWMGWAVHAAESVDAKTRKRWAPMFVPYANLPESEKQKDRVEAMALLDVVRENPLKKSQAILRKATDRDTRGAFIRKRGAAHRRGMQPNPKGRLKSNRPRPSQMPGEIGPGHANVMQESSMQVMHAITQSKRRDAHPDWGFDPLANAPGNTGKPRPVGKPNIFVYKSNPDIAQAVRDYAALLDAGKSPVVALQTIGQRWPWVLGIESPRSRDWWAAVRRADLPRPAQFEGVDTEVDADNTEKPRRKGRAVFWREGPANLGQGIMAPTGSGGAGR